MELRHKSSAALLVYIVALAALECGLFGTLMMWSIHHFHRHFSSSALFDKFFAAYSLILGLCLLTAILLGRNIGTLVVQAATNQVQKPI